MKSCSELNLFSNSFRTVCGLSKQTESLTIVVIMKPTIFRAKKNKKQNKTKKLYTLTTDINFSSSFSIFSLNQALVQAGFKHLCYCTAEAGRSMLTLVSQQVLYA